MTSFFARLLGWQVEIPAEEREALLAYLKEEWKIAGFQDLEAERYNNDAAKYGNANPGTAAFAKMIAAAKRLSRAATELDRRHSTLGPIPDEASSTYVAWQVMYMAYEEWASTILATCQAYEAGVMPNAARIQQLFDQMEKCRERAQNEEGKLARRLKVRVEDWRQLLQESRATAKSEKWEPS
jgi:hypothetical protein